ncbi:hypothetical protein [Microbispora sp. NPDC049125]|uniref:hypothetical protein n=1 Tax=Microbispora sp. NPDC049125 TaxID=3154929 RepID=UPI0034675B23
MTAVSLDRYPFLAALADGRPLDQVKVPVRTDLASFRHGWQNFTLTPGVADEQAVEYFCYGWCYLLAAAIHERTGASYVFIDRLREDGEWRWCHVGILASGGMFLDINGVENIPSTGPCFNTRGEEIKFRVERDTSTFHSFVPSRLDWWNCEVEPLTADVIRYFADQLIARHF